MPVRARHTSQLTSGFGPDFCMGWGGPLALRRLQGLTAPPQAVARHAGALDATDERSSAKRMGILRCAKDVGMGAQLGRQLRAANLLRPMQPRRIIYRARPS